MAPVQEPLPGLARQGKYTEVLVSDAATAVLKSFAGALSGLDPTTVMVAEVDTTAASTVGLAALNAFLQANVTGPVLDGEARIQAALVGAFQSVQSAEQKQALGNGTGALDPAKQLRESCFRSLDIDGVSPYSYIPSVELFCLARHVFLSLLDAKGWADPLAEDGTAGSVVSFNWVKLRVHVWHYRLLTQPSLGPGSIFNKSASWTDVPTLEEIIAELLGKVERDIMEDRSARWAKEEKVRFLLEKANVCITLGLDSKAKEALQAATELNGFVYALSGALGKRTRFQEKSMSQLVVLAKSGDAYGKGSSNSNAAAPEALPLNDDTLLESVEYSKADGETRQEPGAGLPDDLKDIIPEAQPQLSPLDQIILLTQATLKDAFSPVDSLTSEEILPYAERVISDKSTNWQIYTQALLVRSRIEVHRSRTVERGVLQMQAVVDQVVVGTTEPVAGGGSKAVDEDSADVPVIQVTAPDTATRAPAQPTSFLRSTSSGDSAPPHIRLQYIHVLSSPPRWHLESELAYAWVGVGSLVSALEIFKRLRLWAEVALCLASSAQAEDEDGRGSGGEEKAKTVLRWRLFHRTEADTTIRVEEDDSVDASDLKASDFHGPERDPPPPNAPRLYCILGDLEADPSHYERAWELSKHRFARAQKSLGEHYLLQKDWRKGRAAYQKAVAVNRLNTELWGRLGDINLRLGEFEDAAEAYGRAIACAGDVQGGEDARTWSNLGSALWSLYSEAVEERKAAKGEVEDDEAEKDSDEDDAPAKDSAAKKRDPNVLLEQSLAAYKRGASIAQDNWRIWENVVTLASRLRPPPIFEIVQALRQSIRLRSSEDSLDAEVLRLLVNDALLSPAKTADVPREDQTTGPYQPPRGSPEKAVVELLENDVAPLITKRSELWEIISRERVWRRDYAGAIDAAEKAWRAATGGAAAGLLPSSGMAEDADATRRNWLENEEAWQTVVQRTDELVSVLENYGPEVDEVGTRWKGKARSAIRSVMGKGKESWVGSEGWETLRGLLEGLR